MAVRTNRDFQNASPKCKLEMGLVGGLGVGPGVGSGVGPGDGWFRRQSCNHPKQLLLSQEEATCHDHEAKLCIFLACTTAFQESHKETF